MVEFHVNDLLRITRINQPGGHAYLKLGQTARFNGMHGDKIDVHIGEGCNILLEPGDVENLTDRFRNIMPGQYVRLLASEVTPKELHHKAGRITSKHCADMVFGVDVADPRKNITVYVGSLEPWEPKQGERVRVVNPEVLASGCPIRTDPGNICFYGTRTERSGGTLSHRVRRTKGPQHMYILDKETRFEPVIDEEAKADPHHMVGRYVRFKRNDQVLSSVRGVIGIIRELLDSGNLRVEGDGRQIETSPHDIDYWEPTLGETVRITSGKLRGTVANYDGTNKNNGMRFFKDPSSNQRFGIEKEDALAPIIQNFVDEPSKSIEYVGRYVRFKTEPGTERIGMVNEMKGEQLAIWETDENGHIHLRSPSQVELWAPKVDEWIRITSGACKGTIAVYLGPQDNGTLCFVTQSKGTFYTANNVEIEPYLPSTEEKKAEATPPCVWCGKEVCTELSRCEEYQAAHDERLKAGGGVDTEFTRGETRRFVNARAPERAEVHIRSSVATMEEPQEPPKKPWDWDVWSNESYDYP